MFDEVTKRCAGRRAAHRARYLLGSTAAQAAAVGLLVLLGSGVRERLAGETVVPVKIIRSAAPPGGPSALQPGAAVGPRPARPPPRAPAKRPAPRPPPPPEAIVQPKRVAPEPEPGASAPPEEPARGEVDADRLASATGGGSSAGSGEKGPGGDGGAAGAAISSAGPGTGDGPLYPGSGWRRPEQAQRGCVQNSVRFPSSLRGYVQRPVTVKFAIGPDGAPSSFQLIGDVPDARIPLAIWQAIQSCKWIAGADAQGRPVKLWVIMPIRFEAG